MVKECLIIIVSFNQLEFLRNCLNSIFSHTSYPYRILIVDNGSNLQTLQFLKGIKDARVEIIFNRENLGWVKAVNQGFFYRYYPYVCVMNNDTLVYPGWLREMVKVAESNKEIGIVNPLWELPKHFRGTKDKYFQRIVRRQSGQWVETDWARGFCFLVKDKVLERIGGLDEAFSPAYYDDWDFSLRAIKAGFICARAKGAFVWHYKNITYPEVLGKQEFNKIFEEKRRLFHHRWGVPLKILIIGDNSFKEDLTSWEEFIVRLLREQNRLFIIKEGKEYFNNHTNCRVKYSSSFMIKINSLFNIVDNLRHSSHKHYDIIFSGKKTKDFLERFSFIKNNYLLRELKLSNQDKLFEEISQLKLAKKF